MNIFIAQAPAETTSYMIAGYAVIFGVMLIYLVSLVVRNRSLKRDLDTIHEVEQHN